MKQCGAGLEQVGQAVPHHRGGHGDGERRQQRRGDHRRSGRLPHGDRQSWRAVGPGGPLEHLRQRQRREEAVQGQDDRHDHELRPPGGYTWSAASKALASSGVRRSRKCTSVAALLPLAARDARITSAV